MTDDARWMRRAVTLARRAWGMTAPNPLVGAVVVRNGVKLGEGWHHRAGLPHAEIEALRQLRKPAAGATIYVTLEPCSTTGRTGPCTEAILQAKLARVVIGSLDPNPAHAGRGVEILRRAGLEVVTGVEETRCAELNRAFFRWIVHKTPWVLLKMAITLDGKIATASGESQWITGPAARARVQELRRWADAILVGAETVRRDHPGLVVRTPADWPCQPRRLVACSPESAAEIRAAFPDGNATCVNLPDTAAWHTLLRDLGRDGVTALLIEGGGELAASALHAGAIDEVEFHIAPKILGGRNSRTAVGGDNPLHLAAAWNLGNLKFARYGRDVALSGIVEKPSSCLPD